MTNEKNKRPLIAIDFDGVMNKYKGWKGEKVLYKPQNNLLNFIRKVYKDYDITVFTCRDVKSVYEWLEEYNIRDYVVAVTNLKPQAVVYIDDRAIRFNGDYEEVLSELKEFKTWWEE